MPIISVIIPVYNAEKTLDKCLESVVGQTFKDLEIICVDDGSTDDSAEKLAGWQQKDDRIKVLRQENKGGGAARNTGLKQAAGEYVHFLNSDDSLQPKAYEHMYNKIRNTKADVCFCQYYYVDGTTGKKSKSNIFYRCPEIAREESFWIKGNENVFFYSDVVPWNKLYRHQFLKEKKLFFDSVKSGDDRWFYFAMLAKNPLVCLVDVPLVNYMVDYNNESQSNLNNEPAWNSRLDSFQRIMGLFENSFLRYLATDVCFTDLYMLYMKKLSALTPAVKNKICKFLKQNNIEEKDILSVERRGFYRLLTNRLPAIPVVFSSNNNYLPYLAVTLESMLANADKNCFYDIFIFYDAISDELKELLAEEVEKYPNTSVTYFNVNRYVDNKMLYSHAHYSKEMYYRLLIPELLDHYPKALYLDCDLLVEGDISRLYKQDITGCLLAAVRNYTNLPMAKYIVNVLKLETKDYFNSGVLLFDLEECRRFGLKEKCIDMLQNFPRLACPDQDLLNLCCRGKVFFLDMSWNVMWQHLLRPFVHKINLSPEQAAEYGKAVRFPQIIHYTTGYKPWNYQDHILSDKWWHYAVQSPFYHGIVYKYMSQHIDGKIKEIMEVLKLPVLKKRYFCLWIASKLTFGKKRKQLKEKRKELKQQIKAVKKLSKEKRFKTGI